MSQPARNESIWQRTDTFTGVYSDNVGFEGLETHPNVAFARWTGDIRPASTNNPMVNGWREPGAWDHSGGSRATLLPTIGYWFTYDSVKGNRYFVYGDGAAVDASMYGLPAFPQSIEDSAVNRAILKMRGQKVDLGVAFAERRETAKLLNDVCGNIAGTVQRFKSSRPKDWLKVIRSAASHGEGYDVPGAWLELQYGWKPLMSDVQSACQALDKANSGRPVIASAVTMGSQPIRDRWFKTAGVDGSVGWNNQVTGSHKVKVRLDFRLDNPLLATFSQLGLTNPAVIVWERVPYSFVVDWFLPVGDYLDAWTATLGWTFKGGSISRVTKVKVQSLGGVTIDTTSGSRPIIKVFGDYPYREEQFSFSRRILSNLPMPRIPSFKDPISSAHIANAMSLLVNAFRK